MSDKTIQRPPARRSRTLMRLVRGMAGLFAGCFLNAASAQAPSPGRIAFYYGETVDPKAFAGYDQAVVEPDNGFIPKVAEASGAEPKGIRWIAYVSVGEVLPSRDYYKAMPKAWRIGRNGEWKSEVIDQSAPGWPQFFVDKVIAPLWANGYRGFFLDTLDSYQLVARSDAERARQRAGLVAVIKRIHRRFPRAEVIMNRGFELMPEVHDDVSAVAFESLYRGWDEAQRRYVAVSDKDREWLLARAREIRENYGLPVIAIDYCPPTDAACARQTVTRIRADGLVPYVGDGHLMQLNPASVLD
ncbi:sugar ABC transporter [Pandoraea morbifera]|uniref:Sugar ABC transporter n=2 Tax=Pandoraea morbifera TaxID=2508300 RepID=A0A5E4XQI1_9BURK|nr:sugar ABC transporter [Pandoraea morbifera]